MKKTAKYILIMLAVLVVLGGASAALILTQQTDTEETESESSASSSESEALLGTNPSEVESMVVENRYGSYTFVPGDDGTFKIEGYDEFSLNSLEEDAGVTSLLSAIMTKTIGERDDLEDFGLAGDAAVNITINYNGDITQNVVLGNEPGESSGRYVLFEDVVYIVTGVPSNLYENVFAYFSNEMYTIDDATEVNGETDNSQENIVESLKLSGANFPKDIEIVRDTDYTNGYCMLSPVIGESGNSNFETIRDALLTISAQNVVAAGLTDEVLEEFDLKEPAATIEFELNGVSHTMSVSDPVDDMRYCTLDDNNVVYEVYDDDVSSWADITALQLRVSYIIIPNIKNVETLGIESGDETYTFEVDRSVNEDKSTESTVQYDLTVETEEGDNVDYDTAYQPFYAELLAIAVFSVDETEYSGDPVYTVNYSYFTEDYVDTVEFYYAGDDRYAAVYNGQYAGLVRKSEADEVFALLPDVYANIAIEED